MKFCLHVYLRIFFIVVFLLPITSFADNRDEFSVGKEIGDGKNGRRFGNWTQSVREDPIESVTVSLRRSSGGNDTYVNLRFQGSGTFENGRRVYLTDTRDQSITWNVGGKSPQGRPLVLNAYNGEVQVDRVAVAFSGGNSRGNSAGDWTQPPRDNNNARPPFGSPYGNQYDSSRNPDRNNDDRYNDNRYGNNNGWDSHSNDPQAAEYCRDPRKRVRRPRIEISDIESTGGLFSGKYKIRGEVFGECIEEAGYYESGRLKEKFQVPFSDRADRTEFTLKVRSGERGEIRAYTTDGNDERIDVDQEIQEYQNRYQQGGTGTGNTGTFQIPWGR